MIYQTIQWLFVQAIGWTSLVLGIVLLFVAAIIGYDNCKNSYSNDDACVSVGRLKLII